jgi:serine/threonine-protein kinase RsbW
MRTEPIAVRPRITGRPGQKAGAGRVSAGLVLPVADVARPATGVRSQAFPGRLDQVGQARAFAARLLAACPVLDDAVLCVSEFAANAVLHSDTRERGRFTVRVEVFAPDYTWVEVEDDGGPWQLPAAADLAGHGLDIVDKIASEWGVDGDLSGWIAWARLDWPRS